MTATATFSPREENLKRPPCTGIMSHTDDSMTAQTEPSAIDQEFCQAEAEPMEVRSVFYHQELWTKCRRQFFSKATVDACTTQHACVGKPQCHSVSTFTRPCSFLSSLIPSQQQNDTMSDITRIHQHGSTQQVLSSSLSSTAPQHEPLKECQVETVESVTPEPPSSKHRPSNANDVSSDKEEETVESSSAFESFEHATDEDIPMNYHSPAALPQFTNPSTAMWTATHAANAPSEDQSSSLTNVLLRPKNKDEHSLIRLSLWSVIDGHGGGIMATYAAQVLLPHVTASISRSLDCDIVQQGECRVNNELRENAIDFQGLLQSSGKSRYNANSIHYSTPREEETNKSVAKENDIRVKKESIERDTQNECTGMATPKHMTDGPVGTHSTDEIARVTKAVTDSFCAVDEGWINSIDVMTTRQTSCQKNGAWNAGACALVVFTIQRLEWTRTTTPDEPCTVQEATDREETSQKCTIMDCESELTETQDEGDNSKSKPEIVHTSTGSHQSATQSEFNTTPEGCGCHAYSSQPAMLYTAHVGDCRAILLGNALPAGSGGDINGNTVTTDEDLHDNEEMELLSSSESSSSSDDDDDDDLIGRDKTPPHLRYMTRPSRSIMGTTRLFRRGNRSLVPLNYYGSDESDDEHEPARKVSKKNASPAKLSLSSEINTKQQPSVLQLPASVQCLNLTTDHNPYNEAEASAVLRRCNNAPKAIYRKCPHSQPLMSLY